MEIFDALDLAQNDVVALVGGGGKTSIMFALGREAEVRGWKTVMTTTTRIFMPEDRALPVIVTKNREQMLSRMQSEMAACSLIAVGSEVTSDGKMMGVEPSLILEMLRVGADLVITEADGSAGKPFKAPAGHEPVIPEGTTVIVPVVGVDCLLQPILGKYVHRPELVAGLAKVEMGDTLTPDVIARVLTHPLGYRKGLPPNCRWIPFINKVETDCDLARARQIAQLVGRTVPCRVIIGAARQVSTVLEVLDF